MHRKAGLDLSWRLAPKHLRPRVSSSRRSSVWLQDLPNIMVEEVDMMVAIPSIWAAMAQHLTQGCLFTKDIRLSLVHLGWSTETLPLQATAAASTLL